MTARVLSFFIPALFFLSNFSTRAQWWKVQTSGLDTNLRGVSAFYYPGEDGFDLPVVWASGSNGVVLESGDGGETWARFHIPDGETLDFRGIVAFKGGTTYVMSSGEGNKSRIYKTIDGGATWKLQYSDKRKEFFLDSIACLSEKECLALGDPIDGRFLLLKTNDGEHWNTLPTENMPAAWAGEGAFAASNSCLALRGNEIYFVTGGPAARVFHSTDRGLTWSAAETPVAHGNASSGIFSIAVDENHRVIVLGGDYKEPNHSDSAAAYALDSGKTWQRSAQQPGGYRSALARIEDGRWVAVGPTGEDITNDYGVHWKHTDSLNLNAVAILDVSAGWAVGPHGTIARLVHHSKNQIRFLDRGRKQRSSASGPAD
jgi:photosystem II stability/assembly factor-like uncharacterized protein